MSVVPGKSVQREERKDGMLICRYVFVDGFVSSRLCPSWRCLIPVFLRFAVAVVGVVVSYHVRFAMQMIGFHKNGGDDGESHQDQYATVDGYIFQLC